MYVEKEDLKKKNSLLRSRLLVPVMEQNNECSSKLEWEILDLYGGKQQSHHVISPFYCNNDDDKDDVLRISSKSPVFSDSFCRPIKDDPSISACFGGKVTTSYEISTCNDVIMRADNMIITSETISPSSSVVCSVDHQQALINLRLGRQTRESGEIISNLSPDRRNCNKTSMNTTRGNTATTSKRSRASYQNMQNPCCQVEGCNLDLKSAKDYHRRHRICETHSKSARVVVGGLVRRFCQQCSRFHDLSEFDDKKRSCRKRLSDHNARRRRLQPESLHLRSPASSLSSALYDQRSQNVVLNGLSISLSSNSEWDENGMRQQTRESSSLVRPLLNVGSGACFSSDEINPNSISNLYVHSSERRLCSFQSPRSTRVSDQCVRVTSRTDSHMAPDLLSSHSLLSSNSWSLNDAVSSSMNKNSRNNINDGSSNDADMNILAAGQGGSSVSLIHREGTASSSSSHLHDQHGNFFLFHPKEFYE